MSKEIYISLAVIVIAGVGMFIFKGKQSGDPYLDFVQHNKPWQEYEGTKSAIYFQDDHVMIVHDAEGDKFWLADLDDFYEVFYKEGLGCGRSDREIACSSLEELKKLYGVFNVTFSVAENKLSVKIADEDSLNTPQPDIYELQSTLDGKNIKLVN